MLKPIGPTFALVLAACNPESPSIVRANVALDEPAPTPDPATLCAEGLRPVSERPENGPTIRYCVTP